MYAISLDLDISKLKEHYGDPYNNAYFEIKSKLESIGFEWVQGGLYLSKGPENNLASVYKAIKALSGIAWLKKSVRDIKAFKVEDWSDFTEIIKEGGS